MRDERLASGEEYYTRGLGDSTGAWTRTKHRADRVMMRERFAAIRIFRGVTHARALRY